MINMSYCRFENTKLALEECLESLCDTDGTLNHLATEERKAANELVKLCREFADNCGDDDDQT
jgi:hypothetical protein